MECFTVLPRDAMLAQYTVYAVVVLSVRLSVCLSVRHTLVYCTKVAKHKITQTTLRDL